MRARCAAGAEAGAEGARRVWCRRLANFSPFISLSVSPFNFEPPAAERVFGLPNIRHWEKTAGVPKREPRCVLRPLRQR
jgi:hypothetical protein